MTWALCLNCGETKFGALIKCGNCGLSSTGDMSLDAVFSGHNVSVATLVQFGEVIKAIGRAAPNPQERFWAFIHYVSIRHPELIKGILDEERAGRYEEIINAAQPPMVILTRGDARLEEMVH